MNALEREWDLKAPGSAMATTPTATSSSSDKPSEICRAAGGASAAHYNVLFNCELD
jgi:hypothetical protein